jgi:hypothetical protein
VVLVVLAIVWGVLLVSWLRSRTGGTFSDSVGTFRRHLSVLERAAPVTVAPANRLRSGPVGGRQSTLYAPSTLYRPPTLDRPSTLYHQPVRQLPPYRGGYGPRPGPVALGYGPRSTPGLRPPSPAALRRRHAQKRRRDVFFILLAGVVSTFLVALIPGLSVMWAVQVSFDILFFAYVALLIRMRNLAAERELKLTFMPPPAARVPRSRPTYDLGGGYGELGLRRAAN